MMGSQGNIRKEDVVQKLKDDGDFDRLRLMIIRKLKDKCSSAVLRFEIFMHHSLCLPGID
ncbi:hypothetical protein CK203_008919 [Vitis vinifera]|uniref:Uncharacterized protein n=1 Tax=Vitis vinifera TaxID=29760 RepID=A0A438K2S5_VITVI|nr:hypothetical protein CK203_008919 [Vitis vinifera]